MSFFDGMGRPLTRMKWDRDIQAKAIGNGEVQPDYYGRNKDEGDGVKYTPQTIKKEKKRKI